MRRSGGTFATERKKKYPPYRRTPLTAGSSCTKVGDLLDADRHERARDLLATAADKSKRGGNVPFPLAFVLAPEAGGLPPLARFIRGGRGGEVRLRLYLSITMMATRHPYDLSNPPSPNHWSELLALPADAGPRRVSSNIKWLGKNNFIRLTPRPGRPAVITLLDPSGGGEPYVRPMTQGRRYVGVPVEFWRHGWLLALSATATALLLVLLEHQGGYEKARYVMRDRRARYGLSADTWTLARKELEQHRLLHVSRTPQGSSFDYRRQRNTYWVDLEALKTTSPDFRKLSRSQ